MFYTQEMSDGTNNNRPQISSLDIDLHIVTCTWIMIMENILSDVELIILAISPGTHAQ